MKSIPPAAVAAAVAIVLAIVLYFGWKSMNPDTSKTGIGADGKKIDAANNPVLKVPASKTQPGGATPSDAQ